MTDTAEATLAEILTLVLERPVAPGEDVRRADVAKWDSLKHLEIIMAVESAFDVSFSSEEMAGVQGAAEILRKVRGGR
jgi:acyl carrier protein